MSNKKEIANKFNEFFARVGDEISSNVPESEQNCTNYLSAPNPQSMYLDPTSPFDIINITSKIKARNSQDTNDMSTKIMKNSIENVVLPISHIINLTPIFKSGNACSFNNYRPISILPVFSKIFRKSCCQEINCFPDQFYKHQYGFRPGHSTTHLVLQLVNQIAEENDKATKNLTTTTFLDLSKAFDTISHKILLRKLDNFGIRGMTNTWFKNDLNQRTQYMDIYGIKSTLQDITCGVPQGTILGPILFLLYINDIYKSTSLLTLCFADDTTMSFSSSNIPELFWQMNLELYNLNQWLRPNKLCLSINKTKYIIVGPTISQQIKSFPDLTLMIDNQRI